MPSTAVTFLGSGDAFNSGGRAHSCYLVEDAAGCCVVDFGATALMALKRVGKKPSAISSVLLTHLHGDHFAGLPFLLIDGIFREPRGPLTIAGPVGVEQRVRDLARACYRDLLSDGTPFDLTFVEWQDDRPVTVDGRAVLPVPAFHQDPPERAYSLRVATPGASLVFTGDTGWTDRLSTVHTGADLVVAECSQWNDVYDRHLGRADWARLMPSLSGKRVAVSHLGEDALAHLDELRALAKASAVDLTVAEDGLRLEL